MQEEECKKGCSSQKREFKDLQVSFFFEEKAKKAFVKKFKDMQVSFEPKKAFVKKFKEIQVNSKCARAS